MNYKLYRCKVDLITLALKDLISWKMTMKLQGFKKYLLVLLLLGFSGSGWAALYPNPFPGILGDDIDGTGLFIPGDFTLSLEVYDPLELTTAGIFGFEFGFYYGSDPLVLTPIFDVLDSSLLLGPQTAAVDFTSGPDGQVFDLDTPSLSPVLFDNSLGTAPIGFYLSIPTLAGPIFTQALRNPSDADLSAAYPYLPIPSAYLIGFADPSSGVIIPLYASLVGPLNPVPVPGAIFLWLTGLAGLAMFRRRLAAGGPATAAAAR